MRCLSPNSSTGYGNGERQWVSKTTIKTFVESVVSLGPTRWPCTLGAGCIGPVNSFPRLILFTKNVSKRKPGEHMLSYRKTNAMLCCVGSVVAFGRE